MLVRSLKSTQTPNVVRATSSIVFNSNTVSSTSSSSSSSIVVRNYAKKSNDKEESGKAPAKEAMVAPPIRLFGLSARYSNALYSAASKGKALSAVEKDMAAIGKSLSESEDFQEMLKNPLVKNSDKLSSMESVLSKVKASPVTKNFFGVIADNNRLNQTLNIVNTFQEIMMAHHGIVEATVTTATPLDKKSETELTNSLKSFVEKGKKLELKAKVDPTVLGGMLVDIGDQQIDLTIASRIKKMERALMESL